MDMTAKTLAIAKAPMMPYEHLPARRRGKNERIDEPMAQAPVRRTA